MGDVFTQLSVVLVVATLMALLMRRLKQPLIVGHILTGILVGPSLLHLIEDKHSFQTFSEIGIALLLFIIGLELSVSVIKKLGSPVFLTAAAILMTVGTIGFLVGTAFQFSTQEAILLGLAMFFSSTIIIAKVLSDKKEISRLNGQIAIGVILIDDIIATFALLFVAASSTGEALGPVEIGLLLLKGVVVIGVLALLGTKVLPKALKSVAKSQELLFLFALAWGFGVASAVNAIGFSIEIGALFAGVTLAHLPYAHQIGARLKPLRDFFVVLFFISLGENLNFDNIAAAIVPALILSIIVLVLKPLVVMTSLGLLGYTRRTSFKTGVNLSQISEFSIILIVLAASTGMVSEYVSAVVTIVALLTITVSTYLMQYDNKIYQKFDHRLRMFERRGAVDAHSEAREYPLILFGYKNGGHQYLRTFRSLKKKFVVVDYDPEVIEELQKSNVDYLYGDATDPELLAEIHMDSAKLVVNTINEPSINISLVKHIRKKNQDAVIVCSADNYNEAAELYRLGATYVMLPHFIGSERLNTFISTHGISKQSFDNYREKHMVKIGRAALRRK
ncbi:MAG: Transporter, CPA2 family [Candidatus Saccharibacteria bacterium GW2011_GWC2_48_9]|nr:MAG: Transporter, CPA2 family [Candidatus Saccharibacteria bacterium GW2011_GWC2_48_9]